MITHNDNTTPCPVCGEAARQETITYHTRFKENVYVFENVPAFVCNECGTKLFSDAVLEHIEDMLDDEAVTPAPVHDYLAKAL